VASSQAKWDANEMTTLQEICLERLIKLWLGKSETLSLLEIANQLDLVALRGACLLTVRSMYDFFREHNDLDYLREICGEAEIEHLEQDRLERGKFKRNLYQEGTVLGKSSTIFSDLSVHESKYFPLDALVAGVTWPKGVDPRKREDWLSDDDFTRLFKMSKSQFAALPRFQKERRKRELSLW